jgi:hypothetical protein
LIKIREGTALSVRSLVNISLAAIQTKQNKFSHDCYSISLYGSILPPFPNNWAAIVG